jgi:transposase
MARRGPAPFVSEVNQKVIIDWIRKQPRFTVRQLRRFCDQQGITYNHSWLNRLSKEAGYNYYEGWVRS